MKQFQRKLGLVVVIFRTKKPDQDCMDSITDFI